MEVKIEDGWKNSLQERFEEDFFKRLSSFVQNEYQDQLVFPPSSEVFNAFQLCPLESVKVVILGQDPYHGLGQAHGLSFSVKAGVPFPPSLRNILKEIQTDVGMEMPPDGDLTRWAKQGVFLLNATLTVRANQAGSHQNKGWELFTDHVIRVINSHRTNVVFMLWGSYAQKKAELIDSERHLILKAPHPSPLSAYRGFMGCRHFSQANQYLEEKGIAPIKW
ncbi:uracil-DNA glycosylase [Algoriphagus jejuensis]|uniref:Uracil-DNA glycosylase n=1 Tax=Algoriphagus jejuensis TaxID=419934 RepID=A0ABN1N502_9BACT